MWEVFTLAEVPYAEKEVDLAFINWLKAGNRLSEPLYAPNEM